MKNKVKIFIIFIAIIFICLIFNNYVFNSNNNYNINNIADDDSEIDEYLSLLLKKDDKSIENQYNLNADENLLNFNLELDYSFQQQSNITITMFINYKQSSFSINNESATHHDLIVDRGTINIPIELDISNLPASINNLLINIDVNNNFKLITSHNLIKTSTNTLIQEVPINSESISLNDESCGIFLNSTIQKGEIILLDDCIEASPNDMITIPVVIGGYTDSNKYLYSLMLNNKQLFSPNEAESYFNIDTGKFLYKEITVQAPDIVGEYNLYSLLISNPYIEITPETIGLVHLDSSNSLTIKVK